MAKQYLKNLDGLRFIAAAIVAISHLETIKSYASPFSLKNRFITNAPQIAVTFFFVLSGFLIMWWFLEETKGDLKKINILSFYRNRISRTWPLYFLVLLLSIIISAGNGTLEGDPRAVKRYLFYLFFLPNTADVLYGPDMYLGPTWSLAVEEFFYLFFPVFLVRLPKLRFIKALVIACVIFILLSILFSPVLNHMVNKTGHILPVPKFVTIFFDRYRIYSFLLGALSASILYSGKLNKLNVGYRTQQVLIRFTGGCAAVLILFGVTFSFVTQQVYSVFFAFLLLMLTFNGYSNRLLNTSFFKWGGKISYGIYMLHMLIVIRLVNQLSSLIDWPSRVLSVIVSWLLLLLLTCVVSYFSYRFFENPVRNWIRSGVSRQKDEM